MSDSTYQCKAKPIYGRRYSDVAPIARRVFHDIEKKTKRRPYVRSNYFNKEKIFLTQFWQHLEKKNFGDRKRRLKYYRCALELVQLSTVRPTSRKESGEMLYRFSGKSPNGELFHVQIREDLKAKEKHLISVFPPE
ncbi:MAG: hypothetical protein NUV80_01805 [Candidatus Berkelbacteria bacterium]|nr:hypothetical protein [Candidatus Berkelbacteria bacterium]MCR4307271.1 hypothetical protein [Candidatus Berkelbacteria bacterium]